MFNVSFSKVSYLREWLEEKNYECGSGEDFSDWLNEFFSKGNTVTVHGEQYDLDACLEMV